MAFLISNRRILIFISLVIVGLVILQQYCAPDYSYQGKKLYIRNEGIRTIITTTPCLENSKNHLEIENRGIDGGITLFIDMSSEIPFIETVGDVSVVGKPSFQYSINWWPWYVENKDSLLAKYENKKGRFVYNN